MRLAPRSMLAVLACGLGCQMQRPGELVGVYEVTGTLAENTCGHAAVPAPDPLEFRVEIRRHRGSGVWIASSPPGHQGRLDEAGDFEFVLESSFNTGARPSGGGSQDLLEMDPLSLANLDTFEQFERGDEEVRCTLRVEQTASGSLRRADGGLDGGIAPAEHGDQEDPDLVGDNEIEIRAGGGDCSIVLATYGGPFDTLPCRTHHELSGVLVP